MTAPARVPSAPPALSPALQRSGAARWDRCRARRGGPIRSLVETPGFVEFWRAVTPIDEISRLRLGSRPADAARGLTLEIAQVRAIPWVFSWMQSRFNLPGWYGLGAALAGGRRAAGSCARCTDAGPSSGLFLDNAEMSLLKADLGIAALYAGLDPERARAAALFARIEARARARPRGHPRHHRASRADGRRARHPALYRSCGTPTWTRSTISRSRCCAGCALSRTRRGPRERRCAR